MKIVFILTALYSAVTAEVTSYEGYKVFELHPANEEELAIIGSFDTNTLFDFWSSPKKLGLPTTVMVAPQAQVNFMKVLNESRIQYSVVIENVESIVTSERINQASVTRVNKGRISFTSYNRYHQIQDYLVQLADIYPDIVSLSNIGISTEGRNIPMIKIGTGGSNKPIILIEGGMHSREWISPAVVLYIIQELVVNEYNRNLLDKTDWYIIPLLNPDGYEYTHTHERMWRKTRSRGNLNCTSDGGGYGIGVDGNRNFGFHWNEVGTSSDPCSETYGGPYEFSEPETVAMRNVVLKHKDRIKLFLAFHSFGNLLMYPWGHTSATPTNAKELHALATAVATGIGAVYGTRYRVGSIASTVGYASGDSADWVKGVGGVELSYGFELPGGCSWGFCGFVLPASRILNVCYEIFEGVKVFQNYIAQKFATYA